MFNVQHPTRSYILQYLTSSYHWHPGSQAQATCPLWCVMPSWHRAWPAWRISLKVASATGMRWPRCSRTIRDDPLSASKKRLHTATCEELVPYWILLDLMGSYWILLDLIGSYWILLAFCAISRCCLGLSSINRQVFQFFVWSKNVKNLPALPPIIMLCCIYCTYFRCHCYSWYSWTFFLRALRL